jgi:putative two-component system response regulator
LRIKHYTDELENAESVVFSLALGIEANDPYTAGHSSRVAEGSVELAKRLGLPQDQLTLLRRGGLVHDLGKIGVPPDVLHKADRFTRDERGLMEQHPLVGERVCRPLKSFGPLLPIIRHHHERLDGSGYPDGLKGDQIPLLVRIVSVADVYDALTSHRPYRKSLSSGEAIALMREEARQGWWDFELVEEYAKVVGNRKQPAHAIAL